MTKANATDPRTDSRREVKVAPNLYRQPGTDRYRFARMSGGVCVYERFTAQTLTAAKAHANELRTKDVSAFGDKSVTIEALAASYLERESGPAARRLQRKRAVRRLLLNGHVVPLLWAEDKGRRHHRRASAPHDRRAQCEGSCRCIGQVVFSSASAIFKHGVRDLNAIPRNPCRDLEHGDRPSAKRQTEPRYLSVEEVVRLLGKMSDESRPFSNVLLGRSQGL